MGEIGVQALKMGIKISYAFSMVTFFIVFLAMGLSALGVALNGSVLLDLLHLIQMWLPFNLNPLFSWLFTAVSAYLTYRLALIGFTILGRVVN